MSRTSRLGAMPHSLPSLRGLRAAPASLVVGVCVAVLALAPLTARAQAQSPPQAQSPSLQAQAQAQQQAQAQPQAQSPAELQAQAPPPARPEQHAQAVPAPERYVPAGSADAPITVTRTRPSDGHRAIVAGSVLLGVGALVLGGGIGLWVSGCGVNKPCLADSTSTYYPLAAAGLSLEIIGAAAFAAGAVLLPVGLVQSSRYKRWRAEHVAVGPGGPALTF
jgi:hypothetical protein